MEKSVQPMCLISQNQSGSNRFSVMLVMFGLLAFTLLSGGTSLVVYAQASGTTPAATPATTTAPATAGKVGKISGTIVDGKNGQAVVGANVLLVGSNPIKGAVAGIDGDFTIRNVSPGTYSVKVTSVGYTTVLVDDVIVTEGGDVKLGLKMNEQITEAQEIRVTAKAVQGTEVKTLKDRQGSTASQDIVGEQTIARSGAGDAAQASAKVVGVTVVDNKNVFIRGLGDRYATTQLNGSSLPTPDPDKQSVPLDLIPAGLLEGIVISKTFTPDKPGSFSGGAVDLRTKDFPERQTISASVSSSYNESGTNNPNFLSYEPGSRKLDALWDSPEALAIRRNGDNTSGSTRVKSLADLKSALNQTFSSGMTDKRDKSPYDRSYSFGYGNKFQVFGRDLGLNLSYSNSTQHRYYENGEENGLEGGPGSPLKWFNDTKSSFEELNGFLGNIGFAFAPRHQITATYVRTESNEDEARFVFGPAPGIFNNDPDTLSEAGLERFRGRAFTYTERLLNSFQTRGEHQFLARTPLSFKWTVSTSNTSQDTPDRRLFSHTYSEDPFTPETDTTFRISTTLTSFPTRLFTKVDEENFEVGADVSLAMDKSTVFKFGFNRINKDRTVEERRFQYASTVPNVTGLWDGDLDFYTNSAGYRTVINGRDTVYQFSGIVRTANGDSSYTHIIEDDQQGFDDYIANQDITAGYLMFELGLFPSLKLVTGIRAEHTEMFTENGYLPKVFSGIGQGYQSGAISATQLLPAHTLIWNVIPDMNLRGSYTRTLARPTLREFAPFNSEEVAGGNRIFNGNPDLNESSITNIDARWEWFTRPGEVIAVSGFYKLIGDPIEYFLDSDNGNIKPVNADDATLVGIEFEVRSKLDLLHPALRNFELNGNYAAVDAEIKVPGRLPRKMYGQSPYVYNVGLSYGSNSLGLDISANINRFGERITYVTAPGLPSVVEVPRTTIDIVASKKVFAGFSIKGSAKNILGEDLLTVQNYEGVDYTYQSQERRPSFAVGLNWKL